MAEWITAGIAIAGIVFVGLKTYWTVAQLRRDLNGLGRKVESVSRKYSNVSLALMHLASKDEQKHIEELLKETE